MRWARCRMHDGAMSGEWLHLIALALMLAHSIVLLRGHGRPVLPDLAGETVMLLAMLDCGVGTRYLDPILWLAISLVVALLLTGAARVRSRGREMSERDGATAHLALGMIVMAVAGLRTGTEDAGVSSAGAHAHAASGSVLPALLAGVVGLFVVVSAVQIARERGIRGRCAPALMGLASVAMAIPLLLGPSI